MKQYMNGSRFKAYAPQTVSMCICSTGHPNSNCPYNDSINLLLADLDPEAVYNDLPNPEDDTNEI